MTETADPGHSSPVLRGHHLICLQFYNGEGYGAGFIKYLSGMLAAAEKGEIEICEGADCICKVCPHLLGDACAYYENAEADIRGMDARALELLGLIPGRAVSWKKVRAKIEKIFKEWHGLYCIDCSWSSACRKNERFSKLVAGIK